MELILLSLLSIMMGVILFELYAKFYAKGNRKRILFGIFLGGVLLFFIVNKLF